MLQEAGRKCRFLIHGCEVAPAASSVDTGQIGSQFSVAAETAVRERTTQQ